MSDEPALPKPGERPVFGVHRQRPEDARTAPASQVETDEERDARFERDLRA
ncbi:hypothetical protein BH23CHL8_BH23CHL8_26320 [soil metagenome]